MTYKAGLELGDQERRRAGAPSPPCSASRPAPLPTARSPPEPSRATTGAEPGPRSHRASGQLSLEKGLPRRVPSPGLPQRQGKVPRARSRYQQPMMLRAGSQQVRDMGGHQDWHGGSRGAVAGDGAGEPGVSGGDLSAGRLRHHLLLSPPGVSLVTL